MKLKTKHQDRSGEITEEMKGLFVFLLLEQGALHFYLVWGPGNCAAALPFDS